MGFCCGCYCLKESINNRRAGMHIIKFLPPRIQNIPGKGVEVRRKRKDGQCLEMRDQKHSFPFPLSNTH